MGMNDNNSKTIPKIMVFRPKIEEMKDFSKYLEYMEEQGAYKAGLAKIIPPEEWKPRKGGYDNIDLVIKAPIQQFVQGGQGLFQQYNIQKKSMHVKDFKKMAESSKYQTPSYFDYEDLERKYWKNVTFNPAIYGADVSGSLTDEDCKEFNINNLNTCLDMINESYGIRIMGVNTAYLYFGMWKTTFAWHTEDMDLYSINYLHFGAPKSWYCIPPEHGKRLERLANGFFPTSSKQCPAFLRHKMTLISPQVLKKYSIPFNKITQEAGEFMITFPYSYHAGYNHGYNCAESTNFALPRWVEFGKRAVRCNCRADAVKISMEAFVKKFQPDRYELWLEGKDVGPDPKDPSHICAAPAPSTYEKDIMSKFNKHKRHPPHKKDFSDDDDDEDCSQLEKWSPPTKAARKMFDNCTDFEQFMPQPIAPISPDTISSMPKPPTISETIFRLHQNLSSSIEKPKEKKRKKKSVESTVPSHLEHHLYAKTNPCVSSCSQPVSNPNYGYFTQFLINDSQVMQMQDSGQPLNSFSSEMHLNPKLSQINMSSHTYPTLNTTFDVKGFQNTFVKVKAEPNVTNGQALLNPPNLTPFTEDNCTKDMTPSSQPPLLRPPEPALNLNQNNYLINGSLNGVTKLEPLFISREQQMVEASTSTEDLNGGSHEDLASNTLTATNHSNNLSILDHLSKKTLQYTPFSYSPSLQGFTDEIAFNICMSTISPHCAVCTILRPYQMSPSIGIKELESYSPPKTSQILIPSIAFTSKVKDETTLLDSRESSPLIVCMDCRVCVHSVCYGVSNLLFDGSDKWKCDRCAQKDYFGLCYLCPLSGGPLKPTTDKLKDKKWVHISCALLIPEVKFVNGIDKKPIDLTDLKSSRRTDKIGCFYCRKWNPENQMVNYFNGYCIQCSCFTAFHVTCGHRNGVQYKSGDWPEPIRISCKKCSNSSQLKKQMPERDLSDVKISETVIAKHKNKRYYNAKIVDKFEQMFHHVHFVDNSFTKYIKSFDILNRDCEKDPPIIGDAVEVVWNKEQLHGKYAGKHTCLLYGIQFDDGSQIKAKREDFYLESDELPKRVKIKLSKATDRQYLPSDESNP